MKKNKIIFNAYMIFIIFSAIIQYFFLIEWENLNNYNNIEIIGEFVKKIFLLLIIIFFQNAPVFIIYIIIKTSDAMYKKDRLTQIDYIKEKQIYRDILNKFSVAELGYIDNFEIKDNIIAASILGLKLKGKIEFNEEKDEILVKEYSKPLSNNEQYIIEKIKNGKLLNFNKLDFFYKIVDDAKENKLIENINIKKKKIIRISVILLILCIIVGIVSWIGINNDNVIEEELFMYITMFICVPIVFVGIIIVLGINAYKNSVNPYKRTKFGEDVNKKIEGLKKYLEEYSLLEQKRN